MVNDYCEGLTETFAQWVYYGLLDESDAQCFRVESYLEIGSYILAAGAVLLALLNTFVMKAVMQYFRDKDAEEDDRLGIHHADDEVELSEALKKIHPVDVLFTDTFRWFLNREDAMMSRSHQSLMILGGDSKLGINHGFPAGPYVLPDDAVISTGHDLLVDTMADVGEEPIAAMLSREMESLIPVEGSISVEKDVSSCTGVAAMGLPLLMVASSDSGGSDSDSQTGKK
jgi:hypothetical protein